MLWQGFVEIFPRVTILVVCSRRDISTVTIFAVFPLLLLVLWGKSCRNFIPVAGCVIMRAVRTLNVSVDMVHR